MDRINPIISPSPDSETAAQRGGSRTFELALTSMVAATNFVISLYVAPTLSVIIPKVFVGAILMVPLNLCLSSFVWRTTEKKIFTVYFVVFGLLAMPTTVWGSTPGLFKPLLGAAVGSSLDLVAGRLGSCEKNSRYVLALVFPVIWWMLTGAMWAAVGLPIVKMFQAMLGSVSILKPLTEMGFIVTFIAIATMTIPSSFIAVYLSEQMSQRAKRDLPMP